MNKSNRRKKWCEKYQSRGTREINKARKLERHLKKHSQDKVAAKALRDL